MFQASSKTKATVP